MNIPTPQEGPQGLLKLYPYADEQLGVFTSPGNTHPFDGSEADWGSFMEVCAQRDTLRQQLAAVTKERDEARDCGQRVDDKLAAAESELAELRKDRERLKQADESNRMAAHEHMDKLRAQRNDMEEELADLRAQLAAHREWAGKAREAAELLLAGYEGLGGNPENNGPRIMREALAKLRAFGEEKP